MRSLSSVAWRTFRRNFGRLALTATGIALGVAILFGVLVANASSTASLRRQLGRVDIPAVFLRPLGADAGAVPEDVANIAARFEGVNAAWGSVGFMAELLDVATGEDGEPEEIWMFGSTALKERPEGEEPPGGLVWATEGEEPVAGRDEAVLTRSRAAELGVERGDSIEVRTPSGVRSVTITALDYVENGETPPGALRTSLATAQAAFGRETELQDVYIELKPGTDVAVWIDANQRSLPSNMRLVPAEAGLRSLRDLVAVTHTAFTTVAAITLFVAAFLIYLTLSMAVIERSRIYGTMRAVGARRRQVLRLVLSEALVLGAAATAIGLLFGLGAAVVLVRLTGSLYDVDDMAMVVPVGAVALSAALGIAATVAAAAIPARRAARVTPIAAMRGAAFDDSRLSRAWIVGLVSMATGVVLPFLPGRRGLDAGTIFVLVGAVLVVPLVMRPIAAAAGALTRRIARGVGDVGVMHLVKQRSRSAYTLALVMVVLAAVFAIGSANLSIQGTLRRDLDARFASDLVLWGNPTLPPQVTSAFPAGVVDRTTPIWFGHTETPEGKGVELVMIDPDSYFDVQSFAWVRGDDATVQRALDKGGSIVASEALLHEMGAAVGDQISLRTSEGDVPFAVVASYASIELEDRATIGIRDGRNLFAAREPNGLFTVLQDGVTLEEGQAALDEAFAQQSIGVEPVGEERREIRSLVDRYFGVFFAIVLVAAVVGLLGLANTLAISIVQRTREIGVLRAVGTHRRQVAGMVVVESATLVAVAVALAIPLGLLLSVTLLRTTAASVGMIIHYTFPWLMVPAVAVIAVVVGLAAAVAPGRRAARVDPVAALRFE